MNYYTNYYDAKLKLAVISEPSLASSTMLLINELPLVIEVRTDEDHSVPF